jgi:hypothetical protein
MKKALAVQHELGAVFDITCDCEDGAHAGAEADHARMAAGVIMSRTTASAGSVPASTTSPTPTGSRTWTSWSAWPAAGSPS